MAEKHSLHKNYKREQRDQRKQIDIELPDSCRYQSQLDCNDQFMIQSSLDDIRTANDNFTTDDSNTMQESTDKAPFEKTPPKRSKRPDDQGNYMPGMKQKAAPMYADITWGAGGTTSDATMDIAKSMKHDFGLIPNMHLT